MGTQINASKPLYQILVLACICMIPIGSYYGMDSPAPIEEYLKKSIDSFDSDNGTHVDLTHKEYMQFMEIYSVPNIFFCFIAGYIIDSFLGRRKGAILFCSICTIGCFLFSAGAFMNSLVIMYIGRFIFGIGSESVALCEYAYNIHWFDRTKVKKGSAYKPIIGLSFAFSIAITFSRGATFFAFQTLGRAYKFFAGENTEQTKENIFEEMTKKNDIEGLAAINNTVKNIDESLIQKYNEEPYNGNLTAYNYDYDAVGKTLFVAFLVMFATLMLSFFLGYIDILGNRWRKKSDAELDEENKQLKSKAAEAEDNPVTDTNADEDDGSNGGFLTLEDLKSISYAAWLIIIICSCYYMVIFPFVSQGKEYFKIKRGVTNDEDASWLTSSILVLSGFGLAPAIGFLIDNFYYNGLWLIGGVTTAVFGHFAMWTMPALNNNIITIIMGIGYSAVAGSLWPLMGYNVPKKISSTCYGLMQSIQVVGLFISYRLSGIIMDKNISPEMRQSDISDELQAEKNAVLVANYDVLSMYFTICAAIALGFSVLLVMNKGVDAHDRQVEDKDEQELADM